MMELESSPAMAESEEGEIPVTELLATSNGGGGEEELGWEWLHEWLQSLPMHRTVSRGEIDAWRERNKHRLIQEIATTSRLDLYRYIQRQHKTLRRNFQTENPLNAQSVAAKPRKHQTKKDDDNPSVGGKPVTEKWRPVWEWLQTLDRTEVLKTSEVIEWLNCHPDYAAGLRMKHTNSFLYSYVQKCHLRVLNGHRAVVRPQEKKIRPLPNENRLANGRFTSKNEMGVEERKQPVFPAWRDHLAKNMSLSRNAHNIKQQEYGGPSSDKINEADVVDAPIQWQSTLATPKAEEPKVRGQLHTSTPSRRKRKRPRSWLGLDGVTPKKEYDLSLEKVDACSQFELILSIEMRLKDVVSTCKAQTSEVSGVGKAENPKCAASRDPHLSKLGKRGQDIEGSAWVYTDISSGTELWAPGVGNTVSSVVEALWEREYGANSGTVAFRPKEIGRRGQRWTSVFNGWNSLEKQRVGPADWLQKRAYSTWVPSWCAYTSSVAVAQPLGSRIDQGIQKVLDVRFHPGGLPQLVCSCNEAPNELLLYNLVNGRGRELIGHNTQIQAVEFALGGDRIVSSASNTVKVWDSMSGTCLHTLGPGGEDGTAGHKKKISAMAVNQLQSCLVATSGGEGDNQLLLWNVLRGQLAADVNADFRRGQSDLLSMDALKFCNEKYLVAGSDSPHGKPAVVQIWDIDALHNVLSFPAHDTYITCLDINPSGSTLITGAGDGSVGLFDLRSGGGIARLPLSSEWEVTSVSFSGCGSYFQASCTGNCSFIWDTRMMPMEPGPKYTEQPPPLAQKNSAAITSFKALHCVSHGYSMPTAQNSFQVPGYVDDGDQGVNDARWFHNEAILVTASGNGSIAMWDVSLGQPCVQHISSHSRCINTVAVSPTDQFICTGGDDQKVLLYENMHKNSQSRWRLTHPLSSDHLPIQRPQN